MKKVLTLRENITPLPTPCAIDAVVNDSYPDSAIKYHTVLIAFAWLDAQVGTKNITKRQLGLKRIIGNWASHHVSRNAIRIAARLHPRIEGDYPFYNISSLLVEPDLSRIAGMNLAHHNIAPYFCSFYSKVEVLQ